MTEAGRQSLTAARMILVVALVMLSAACNRTTTTDSGHNQNQDQATTPDSAAEPDAGASATDTAEPEDSSGEPGNDNLPFDTDEAATDIAAEAETEEAPEIELPPLNLVLPKDAAAADGDKLSFTRPEALPNLFDTRPRDKQTSVKGKVFLDIDPQNPDYVNAIEGGQVTIKQTIPKATSNSRPKDNSASSN